MPATWESFPYCFFIPSTPTCIFSHPGTPITCMPHGLFPNDHPSFLIIHIFYCLVFLDLKTQHVFALEKKNCFPPGSSNFLGLCLSSPRFLSDGSSFTGSVATSLSFQH